MLLDAIGKSFQCPLAYLSGAKIISTKIRKNTSSMGMIFCRKEYRFLSKRYLALVLARGTPMAEARYVDYTGRGSIVEGAGAGFDEDRCCSSDIIICNIRFDIRGLCACSPL